MTEGFASLYGFSNKELGEIKAAAEEATGRLFTGRIIASAPDIIELVSREQYVGQPIDEHQLCQIRVASEAAVHRPIAALIPAELPDTVSIRVQAATP